MATLDAEGNAIVIRVVYDGAPGSGKTTTLRALAQSLGRPLYTPEELGGRTIFFDWLEYTAGVFEGHRVRCQLVSVPGQAALEARRRWLLLEADAVIFVADTTRPALQQSLDYFRSSHQILDENLGLPVGTLIQANKRDAADAVPLEELRGKFDSRRTRPGLVESTAIAGDGVRQAFVFGVRLALDRARAALAAGQLRIGPALIESGVDLEKEIRNVPVTAPLFALREPVPIVAGPTRLPELAEAFASVVEEQEGRDAGPASWINVTTPRLPDATVPGGAVWPPVEGRLILHEMASTPLEVVALPGGGWSAGNGTLWDVSSRANDGFSTFEQCRAALIPWARLHTSSPGISAQRCIAGAPAGDGSWRLWQVLHRQKSLRQAIVEACARPVHLGVAHALTSLLTQLMQASHNLSRLPRSITFDLDNVGPVDQAVVYIGLMPKPSVAAASTHRTSDPATDLSSAFASLVKRELQDRRSAVLSWIDPNDPHEQRAASFLAESLHRES